MDEDATARNERLRLRALHRVKEIHERVDELERQRWTVDANIAEARGSGTEQVRLARENLERARQAADEAAALAVDAYEAAAYVHDLAAALHDRLAALGAPDSEDRERRAAEHRRAAGLDRDAAAAKRADHDHRAEPAIGSDTEP